jgi:hypothetical protein
VLGGDPSSLLGKGTGLLGSIFGDSLTAPIASAISRFTGLNVGTVRSLLALLMPLVLGKVASQWKNQGGTPNALTSMFAEQKRNIYDALPSGFAIDDIPGLTGAKDAVRVASQTTRRGAETAQRSAPSIASWLLPLAVAVVGGLLLWNFLRPRAAEQQVTDADAVTVESEEVTVMKPAVPDMPATPTAAQLTGDINATFKTLGETFAGITDAASAEAAAPKLQELSAKLDSMKKMLSQLPETGRATLIKSIESQLNPMKEKAEQTLALPGLSERIKTLIGEIVRKLEEWHIIGGTD